MTRGGNLAIALAAAWTAACIAQPAWVPASDQGSMSGRASVTAIAVDPAVPEHVYAATGGGVFLSVDGGAGYAPLPSVPTSSTIRSLAVLRDSPAAVPRLLVGTQNDGLFASPDGGLTYTRFVVPGGFEVPGGLTLVPTVWNLYGAAGSGTIAFMWTGAMYRTDDGGLSWRALALPETYGDSTTNLAVASDGNLLFAGRTSGLFRSVDGGEHWAPLAGGLPAGPFGSPALPALDPADANRVSLIIPGTGVYRSDNGGTSWRRTGDAPFQCCIYTLFASGDTLWSHINAGVALIRSRDAGATWGGLPLPSGPWPIFLRDQTTGRLFAASGTYEPSVSSLRSLDGGDTWVPSSGGLGSAAATFLSRDPGRAIYAVTQGGTLHALTAPNPTWHEVTPAPPVVSYRPVLVTGPSEVMTSGPTFWRSADEGAHWITSGAYNGSQIVVLAAEPGGSAVYGVMEQLSVQGHSFFLSALLPRRTVDGGATWTSISEGLPVFTNQLVATGGGRLVAGTNAGIWFSADAGASWREVAGIGGTSRALRPRTGALETVYLLTDAGFYRSVDGGATFARRSDLPSPNVRHVVSDTGIQRIFLVTADGGVYGSEDDGTTWSIVGETPSLASGLRATFSDVVASPWSPSTLYAATTRGVLKFVARPDVAVAQEFHHAAFDHYFITTSATEAAKLATWQTPGWRSTGRSFSVIAASDAKAPNLPVCRFFSASFAPRSSHFYTPYADECAEVKAGSAWTYEGVAFTLALPEGSPGARECPPGMQPLYRAYNNYANGAPNHRYTIDAGILDQMTARGWIMEGEVATRVFACVPAQD